MEAERSENMETVAAQEDDEVLALVEDLQAMGINAADIKKLKESSITTVPAVLMTTRKDLLKIKGFSEAKVIKLLECAGKMCPQFGGFVTGMDVMDRRSNILKITTGCNALDEMLGGGIESMSITEIFGEFRTGKTQMCHTLAVTAQMAKENNGGAGKVIFVDTEGTFRPKENIVPIAERFGLDPNQVLDNIVYARAYTSDAQMDSLRGIACKMAEEKFSLVIIDSSMALFRTDFVGRGELSDRQSRLGKYLGSLRKLADQFNVAVVITNQVMSDPSGGMTFNPDPKKPVGGHVMAHASTTRLYLRKGRGDQRICKMYDSPSQPEAECIYQLSSGGICEPTD